MPTNPDLLKLLDREYPIKSLIVNGEQVKFWNPADADEGTYLALQDVQGEIAALDGEINQDGLKKQAELEARQTEIDDAIAAEDKPTKGKRRSADDRMKAAMIVAEINKEVETFKKDRQNKQRTRRTPLYRRYLECVARLPQDSFAALRPSQIHALYGELKPLVDRVLEDPSDFDPDDSGDELGNAEAANMAANNGRSTITEPTLQTTSPG